MSTFMSVCKHGLNSDPSHNIGNQVKWEKDKALGWYSQWIGLC